MMSPEFYADFKRECEADGVDLDAMSPYANIATLPAFQRANGREMRRVHRAMFPKAVLDDADKSPSPAD